MYFMLLVLSLRMRAKFSQTIDMAQSNITQSKGMFVFTMRSCFTI